MATIPPKTTPRAGLRDSNKENAPSITGARSSTGSDTKTKPVVTSRANGTSSRANTSLSRARADTANSIGRSTGGSLRSPRTSTTTATGGSLAASSATANAPKLAAKFTTAASSTKAEPRKQASPTATRSATRSTDRATNASRPAPPSTSAAPRVMSAATRKALERRSAAQAENSQENIPTSTRASKLRETPSPSKFIRTGPSDAASPPGEEEELSASESARQAAERKAAEDALTAEERAHFLRSPLLKREDSLASPTATSESPVLQSLDASLDRNVGATEEENEQGMAIQLHDQADAADVPQLNPPFESAGPTHSSRPTTPLPQAQEISADSGLDFNEANNAILALSPLPSPSRERRPLSSSDRSPVLRGGSAFALQDLERQLVSVKAQNASTAADLKSQLNEKTSSLEREQRNVKELEHKLAKLVASNNEMLQERDTLERIYSELKDELQLSENRIDELETSAKRLEHVNYSLSVEKNSLSEDYTRVAKEAAEKIEAMQQMENDLVELRGQLAEVAKVEGGLPGLFEQIQKLIEQNEMLDERNTDLEQRIVAVSIDRDICNGEVDRLRAEIKTLDTKTASVKTQLAEALETRDSLHAELQAEVSNREIAETNLDNISSNLNAIKTELRSRLNSQDHSGRIDFDLADEEAGVVATESQKILEELRKLVQQNRSFDAELNHIRNEKTQSQKSFDEMQSRLEEKSTETLELQKQIEKFQGQVDTMWNLDASLKQARDELLGREEELEALKSQITELEGLRQDHEHLQEKHKLDISAKDEEVEALESQITELQDLHQSHGQLQAKHNAATSAHNETLTKLRETIEHLKDDNAALTSRLEEERSKNLEEKFEVEKAALLNSHAEEINKARSLYEDLREEHENLTTTLEVEKSRAAESFEMARKEYQDAVTQLEFKSRDALHTLQQEKQELTAQLEKEQREAADKNIEQEQTAIIEANSFEIEQLQDTISKLQTKNADLIRTASNLLPVDRMNLAEVKDPDLLVKMTNRESLDIFRESWNDAVSLAADGQDYTRLQGIIDEIPDGVMIFVVNCAKSLLKTSSRDPVDSTGDFISKTLHCFCVNLIKRYENDSSVELDQLQNMGSNESGESSEAQNSTTLLHVVFQEILRSESPTDRNKKDDITMEPEDFELHQQYSSQLEAARQLLTRVEQFRAFANSVIMDHETIEERDIPDLSNLMIKTTALSKAQSTNLGSRPIYVNGDHHFIAQLEEQRAMTDLSFHNLSSILEDLQLPSAALTS